MEKHVVVTLHGIRTRGVWQKDLTSHLTSAGLIAYHLDYGFFYSAQFFLPFSREAKVTWLKEELDAICKMENCNSVSVIAHSFGTYLVTEVFRRYPNVTNYYRVVLSGSIVKRNFAWITAFENKRVSAVRNEIATKDSVVKLADFVSRRLHWFSKLEAGQSGVQGFSDSHPCLVEKAIEGEHSDTHVDSIFSRWARFVAYPRLGDDFTNAFIELIEVLRSDACGILGAKLPLLRANMFLPFKGKLTIAKDVHDNMNFAPELKMNITIGQGCTGLAFKDHGYLFVERMGNQWSSGNLPKEEAAKLDPRLKWVLSFAVLSKRYGHNRTLGVVNIDGLDETPAIFSDLSSTTSQTKIVLINRIVQEQFGHLLDMAFEGATYEDAVHAN